MDLAAAFGIFLACVAGCMVKGFPLYGALLVGFVCFFAVGVHRGTPAGPLMKMAGSGMVTSLKVLRILLLLGLLTALWRAGGTVAFFVWVGVRFITPGTFVLVAFLLSSIFSLAFGSCFGVVGTAGVILMTIARSGGANLAVTAGAIMSGIYFGERLSPASSSAALVSAVAEVDQRDFQIRMWRDTPVPFLLTLALYVGLSIRYPIQSVDTQVVAALEEGFSLTWITVLPAVALLALPWAKVSTIISIAVSCVIAAGCALFVQDQSLGEILHTCVSGYQPASPELAELISGGGLISMISVCLIVILSCAYSGMFNGTGLLAPVTSRVDTLSERIGLFGAHVVVSFGCCALFCNQTVGIVMSGQVLGEVYYRRGLPSMELAANVGNSVVNLAGLVPWAIAATVPLTTMEVGPSILPFAFYLYLLPLWCWFRTAKKHKNHLCDLIADTFVLWMLVKYQKEVFMDRTKAAQNTKKLVAQMALEEKVSQLRYDAPPIPHLDVPAYNWWNEALHGVARAGTATSFPQAIGLAAMFDDDLLKKLGDVAATEGRAKYNAYSQEDDRDIYKGLTFWSPNINIFQDPRWGRGHETYGDVVVSGSVDAPANPILCGFQRVGSLPGERKTIKIPISPQAFTVVNDQGERISGSGSWTLYAHTGQPDSRTLQLTGHRAVCLTLRS